ncbi:MAG: thioredoxin-disulfide reductase [Caldisericum sp.]|jgi:thioredoxin reductase (NADPH)|uniref:thioredoxin-disulfide reductase n=1 Tax=Caldisericum sp. TaxID=2499687 RepID=UPI003D14FC6B
MDEFFSIHEVKKEKLDIEEIYDLAIIGGGPAGLTAAIYAARFRLKFVLFEKVAIGGQIAVSEWVENYPGFPEGISGADLVNLFKKQAERFGTNIVLTDVRKIEKVDDLFYLETEYGKIRSWTVILATGAEPVKLPVPEEEKFRGRGISYCATCDAAFFKNKTVAVIGGGDTAIHDALTLSKFADKVIVVHRRKELRATKILQEAAFSNPKISFELEYIPAHVLGDKKVEGLEIEHVITKEHKTLKVDGVFVAIGEKPNSDLVKGLVNLDDRGFVITNMKMETSLTGLYAVGDVRNTPLRQVITACGDAAIAAAEVDKYIKNL